jgi:hypothetical protein
VPLKQPCAPPLTVPLKQVRGMLTPSSSAHKQVRPLRHPHYARRRRGTRCRRDAEADFHREHGCRWVGRAFVGGRWF